MKPLLFFFSDAVLTKHKHHQYRLESCQEKEIFHVVQRILN